MHAWFAFARRAARDEDRRDTVLSGLPAGGLQLGLAQQLHRRVFPRVAVLASFDPARRDSFLAAVMLRAQVPAGKVESPQEAISVAWNRSAPRCLAFDKDLRTCRMDLFEWKVTSN